MYSERRGDLFAADDLEALAHGVNCRGVMGAGIAKAFRTRWPEMYHGYRSLAEEGTLQPGGVYTYRGTPAYKAIFNLCSQERPGPDAKLRWIASSVANMVHIAEEEDILSIGIPRVGCGIGGLDWIEVRMLLETIANESSVELVAFSL